DLREAGLGALAVGRDAGGDGHGAARRDAHRRAVPAGAGELAVDAEAEADQPARAPRLRLLGPESGVVDPPQRLVERALVVAAVVAHASRPLVGEGVGGDEVAAAHLGGVEGELAGDRVHQPLEHVGGLGAAGAAVGAGGGGVGHHAAHADAQVADAVGPG